MRSFSDIRARFLDCLSRHVAPTGDQIISFLPGSLDLVASFRDYSGPRRTNNNPPTWESLAIRLTRTLTRSNFKPGEKEYQRIVVPARRTQLFRVSASGPGSGRNANFANENFTILHLHRRTGGSWTEAKLPI